MAHNYGSESLQITTHYSDNTLNNASKVTYIVPDPSFVTENENTVAGSSEQVFLSKKEHTVVMTGQAPKRSNYNKYRHMFKEFMAEFLGTMILYVFGAGALAQTVLNPVAKPLLSILNPFGNFVGLTLGIMFAAPVSGGHVNPAVTLSFAVFRKFPWRKVPLFIVAQILGAIAGACLVMLFNYEPIDTFGDGSRETFGNTPTATIFASYPYGSTAKYTPFLTNFFSTSFFILGIFGISDKRTDAPSWFRPVAIGLLLAGIMVSCGWYAGPCVNPAFDFGGRLFTLMAGWGTDPFTAYNYYFWVPLVSTLAGGVFGGLAYEFLIVSD